MLDDRKKGHEREQVVGYIVIYKAYLISPEVSTYIYIIVYLISPEVSSQPDSLKCSLSVRGFVPETTGNCSPFDKGNTEALGVVFVIN